MATYAKLVYKGKVQTVALMEGLEVDEVNSLLKTVFGIGGNVVGVLAEKGLVIPISLVCRSPRLIPSSTCKILVSNPTDSSPAGRSHHNPIVPMDETNDIENSSDDDDEEAAAQSVVNEIGQFLDSLKRKKGLSTLHHQLLRRLLTERSALLFAAYSVAVSAGDPEYLSEICKDIATSLQTDEGRTACEAQDEVLQVCDQLYLQNKITESQLLYLRHLTLIRDTAIANVYDEFQEHNSVTLFAKSLYEVANSHPFKTEQGNGDENNDEAAEEDDDEEEDEDNSEDDEQDEEVKKDISSGLMAVIVLMLRSDILSRTDAQVLLEMVQREDDYVMAAYELFLKDNNMEDLQDTLLRCVRLEIRKRVTDIQERELASMQEERELEKLKEREMNYDEATDADEEGDQDMDSEDYETGKIATKDFGLEAIGLDSLLAELGVDNQWKGMVPDQFVQAVFIAVYRKNLTVEQARALCDLFQANYDLVHAAWEVYVVQKDTIDFIDTVQRIVRDLNLAEVQQTHQNARKQAEKAANTANRVKQSAESTRQQQQQQSPSKEKTMSPEEYRIKSKEVEEAKSKALEAIDQAKSELLRHSLEMMVKQNMISQSAADDLHRRHLKGDKLTDAAIEAYAADRDVNEFIDTLQMLASHSKEELDVLMGHAIAEHEKQENNDSELNSNNNESDEEKTAKRYLVDAALQQIEEIVTEMLKNEMISAPVASAFARLISDKDERLVDAYRVFMQNRNGTELIDSMLKVVIDSVQSGVTAAAAAAGGGEESSKNSSPAATSSAAGTKPVGSAQVLDKFDQKQIVDILFQSNALSGTQYNQICRLIESGDANVGRVFRAYETSKDVMQLVQHLQSMNAMNATASKETSTNTNQSEEGGDDDDNEEDDDNVDQQAESDDEEEGEEDEETLDERDAGVIETRFMQIIQGMTLSELEQTALRLAIAENDPAIRNAIDAFRGDLNEERLVHAMRTAARAVIHRTLSSASRAEEDEEDDAENNGSDEEEEEEEEDNDENDEEPDEEAEEEVDDNNNEDDEEDEGDMMHLNRQHYQREQDEDDEEEEDDDDNDDDEEEDEEDDDEEEGEELGDEGVSLITSKSARDHVFPILVQELVKESIISRGDGAVIMSQFAANNPIVSTALDRYDMNNDMAMLVDALQQMVENIQNESN